MNKCELIMKKLTSEIDVCIFKYVSLCLPETGSNLSRDIHNIVTCHTQELLAAIKEDTYSKMTDRDIIKRLDEIYEAVEECKPKKCKPVYTTGPSHVGFVFQDLIDNDIKRHEKNGVHVIEYDLSKIDKNDVIKELRKMFGDKVVIRMEKEKEND